MSVRCAIWFGSLPINIRWISDFLKIMAKSWLNVRERRVKTGKKRRSEIP
jgi:hypothetical protein